MHVGRRGFHDGQLEKLRKPPVITVFNDILHDNVVNS